MALLHSKGEVWELQLKGSGRTPYSRYYIFIIYILMLHSYL